MTIDVSNTVEPRRDLRARISRALGLTRASSTSAAVVFAPDPMVMGAARLPTVAERPVEAASRDGADGRGRPVGGLAKRVLDLVVASLAIIAIAPLMVVIALLIRLADPGGPIIFAHRRVGFRGRHFYCLKFRTMRGDADRILAEYLAANPEAEAEWQRDQKLRFDPRVSVLGRMLRKSSLDELPQLLNVLRGEMSCVGPRPIVLDELPRYDKSVEDYLKVRPGITGLWQVSGRNQLDYPERVRLDSYYVTHWSLGSDALILVKTAFAVIRVDQAF